MRSSVYVDDHVANRQSLTPKFRGIYANAREIQKSLQTFSLKSRPEILMVSKRPIYFDASDLFDSEVGIESVTFVSSRESLRSIDRKFDLVIVCQHAWEEYELSFLVRARGIAELVAVWTFDNHHQEYRNVQANQLADVVFPSHAWCASGLSSPYHILGRHVPLCSAQWSRRFLSEQILQSNIRDRRDELSGGYILWGTERDQLLRELAERLPANANAIKLISSTNRASYFSLSTKDRLETWTGFKVSLCLPLTNDVSFRIFDSLITGQIPIVPLHTFDFDHVISKELQDALPVVRIGEITAENVCAAWRRAIARFDADGQEGVLRRHKYALDNHHVSGRIGEIVRALRDLSTAPLEWRSTEKGVGLFASEKEP